jgi:hypothetical protein
VSTRDDLEKALGKPVNENFWRTLEDEDEDFIKFYEDSTNAYNIEDLKYDYLRNKRTIEKDRNRAAGAPR